MFSRIDKVNKNIQRIFGEILLKEADTPPDVLITVARVETKPNLSRANIWLYIHPFERSEEIVQILKDQIYYLQGSLNKALDLKPLPRISLRVDYGAEHSDNINATLQEIEQSKKNGSRASNT